MKRLFEGYKKWVLAMNLALPVALVSLLVTGNLDYLVSETSLYYIGGMAMVFAMGWASMLAAAFSKHVTKKRLERIGIVSSILVHLGLIGTVLGFIISLNDADFANASINSATDMTRLIGAIATGLGLALQTTLFGSVGALFLNFNLSLLMFDLEDRE